jgi:hypothetical protein
MDEGTLTTCTVWDSVARRRWPSQFQLKWSHHDCIWSLLGERALFAVQVWSIISPGMQYMFLVRSEGSDHQYWICHSDRTCDVLICQQWCFENQVSFFLLLENHSHQKRKRHSYREYLMARPANWSDKRSYASDHCKIKIRVWESFF